MLIAILILTVFNTGLILFCLMGNVVTNDNIIKALAKATAHTDQSIEAATTALYNMDSIKQKVEMSGEVEV